MDGINIFFSGFLFGAIGMAYIMYGKSQQNFVMLTVGVLLCVYPYFVNSLLWTLVIGVALTLTPVFIKGDEG